MTKTPSHRLVREAGLVFVLATLSATQMGGCGGGGGGSGAGGAAGALLSLMAGSLGGPGNLDGTGSAARFSGPSQVATDGVNLFLADTSNHTIRKTVIATGVTTTIAGTAGVSGSADGTGAAARFNTPWGVATDGTSVFVADTLNYTIRRITLSTGATTTIAGTGGTMGSADGTGAAARFDLPESVAINGGNLYVADTGNNTIRQVVIATGATTTFAGTAGPAGSADGIGAAARFNNPDGIATDGFNLFVSDDGNNTIRKIVIATASVTTLAGTAGSSGSADGTGTAARFNGPVGVATDGTFAYVADQTNNTVRRIVISSGVTTTLAGTAGVTGSADGTGAAAQFDEPIGVALNGTKLFVSESGGFQQGNNDIRQIDLATAAVTAFAGKASARGSADGTGTAARFFNPAGVATDGFNLYVADGGNHTIRQVVILTGFVSTLAGTAGMSGSADGSGAAARFNKPTGVVTDGTSLWVADGENFTIRKILIATGAVTTVAGTAGSSGSADGTGAAARFGYVAGITTDGTNLFVADTGNDTIRKMVLSTAAVTTLAGTAGSIGSADGTGAAARFNAPRGVATDGTSLFVADAGNNTIRQIVISTRGVTTLAGTAGVTGSVDGAGAAAQFNFPVGIALIGSTLYISDQSNSTIRTLNPASATVGTLVGSAGKAGVVPGPLPAILNAPWGLAAASGTLYITNNAENSILTVPIP